MNILIDARVGQYPGSGTGVYINSLVHALERIITPEDSINLLMFRGKKLHPLIKQCKRVDLHFSNFGLEWSPQKVLLDGIQINSIINKCSIDIFHSPHFLRLRNAQCRCVVTIQDLYSMFGPLGYNSIQKKLYWQHVMRRSVYKSDAIIAASDYTRDNIHGRFHISDSKIKTIYHGPGYMDNESLLASGSPEEDARKYILFVGAPKPSKNLGCLIEAYKAIAEPLSREYELLLVGPPGRVGPKPGRYKGFSSILKGQDSLRINWISSVSDARLKRIYEKAQLFLHPSLAEGFGLPLVEAMSCGLPILASDISINHEIAGDSVIYFDPYSPMDLRQKIEKVLTDSDLRDSLKKSSLERANRYSWDVCAKEHYETYSELLEA